jgi:hypothetical protein
MSDTTDIVELLRKIGIRASREAIEAFLVHAAKAKASPTQVAEQLCTLEQREREVRNLARRAKMATLGTPKSLDRFDWNHPRSIDRELFEQLYSSLDFVRRGENVLLRRLEGGLRRDMSRTTLRTLTSSPGPAIVPSASSTSWMLSYAVGSCHSSPLNQSTR